MATISRARQTADARSGGKIVRDRRIAAAKTPYDRPTTLPTPTQNRNWLTGVVFPATRMIANGAGKLFSFVAGADSSSSSSESDSEDDDADNDNDERHILPDEADGLNKKNGTSSETIKCFRKEPQVTVGKSGTKCVIERLLMQETFSREECDRLIKIINSRVVDYSTVKEGQNGLSEIPSRTADNDVPDLYSKAVMEAKRWLEEKKVGSSSKSDLDHVTEGEAGSPVDVAKSYMRSRSPWVSPSISHVDLKTPSPVGIELFKEGTSFPVGNSFSSSKKRDSLATGSWNILEEVRRVRSKATDDMLRSLPSKKIDLSLFAQEPKTNQNILVAGETAAVVENKMQESNSLAAAKTIDASANLAAEVSISHVAPVSEMTQDGSQNKALSSSPAIFVSEQNQDMEGSQIIKGGVAASESHHSAVPDFASNQHNDSRSSIRNGSTAKEVTELRSTSNANGFPHSEFSLSAGLDAEKDPRPSDSENPIPIDSSPNKLNTSIPVEETCKLLSETSVEVPVENETIIVGDSENSSSMNHEELPQKQTQPELPQKRTQPELPQKRTRLNSTRSLVGKRRSMVENQEGKRSSRYNRMEKGRGK